MVGFEEVTQPLWPSVTWISEVRTTELISLHRMAVRAKSHGTCSHILRVCKRLHREDVSMAGVSRRGNMFSNQKHAREEGLTLSACRVRTLLHFFVFFHP